MGHHYGYIETGRRVQQISHFELLGRLGAGGMGIVYKARDIQLNRLVALKVLAPKKPEQAERRRRFLQEARSASALNHPNIVTIYEIITEDNSDFIAMEFVSGKTLQQMIRRNGLRVSEAVKIAVQVADALSAAHASGIIHRDLKPANVMVTPGGTVKLLDFGLAKVSERPAREDSVPTETVRGALGAAPARGRGYPRLVTEAGAIVGTVAYMSPEQAEGRKIDARSDIFSFGSMLYEMLTGVRPFQRDTKEATLNAIVREEPPPPSQSIQDLSPELEHALLGCLRKDPAKRWQQIADVKIALEEVKEDSGLSSASGLRATVKPRRWAWGAGLLVVLIVATGLVWLLPHLARGRNVPLPAVPIATFPGVQDSATFSPDGSRIAFLWTGLKQDNVDIYVTMSEAGTPLPLTSDPANDISPAWSPDERWIAFGRVLENGRYAVMLVPPIRGPEQQVTEAWLPTQTFPGPYIAWTPDGTALAIVDKASPTEPFAIFLVSVHGGEKHRLTSPAAKTEGDTSPAFSPDGRKLAFSRRIFGAASEDLYLLPLDANLQPDGEPRRLTKDYWTAGTPAWTPDSREIIFSSDKRGRSNLYRINATRPGEPSVLPFGDDAGAPAISLQRHRLAYTHARSDVNLWRLEVAGARRKLVSRLNLPSNSTHLDFNPQYSPDGRRIAFASDRTGAHQIWVCDADGSNCQQLTHFAAHMIGTPRWSPDGQWIAFDSNRTGDYEIYVVSANGGSPRQLVTARGHNAVPSWSHDGKWIYFSSNRTGTFQEWKMPFAGGDAVQVTRNGAYVGFESPDGKLLYYTKSDGATSLWKVPVGGGEEEQVIESVAYRAFAVTTDGIYYLSAPSNPGAFRFFGFATTQPRPTPTPAGVPAAWLRFFSFATGKSAAVAPIAKPVTIGLSASADGRWILYSQIDEYASDLMLVEKFR